MKSSASTSRTLGVGQIFPLIFYFLVTVVGWVAPVVRCHVSRVPIYTLKKVNLRFPRELTKELIRRPNAGTTPTVTSYPFAFNVLSLKLIVYLKLKQKLRTR